MTSGHCISSPLITSQNFVDFFIKSKTKGEREKKGKDAHRGSIMEMDTSLTDCVLVVSVFIASENSEPEATVFSRANSGGRRHLHPVAADEHEHHVGHGRPEPGGSPERTAAQRGSTATPRHASTTPPATRP
jgi:hypothetical protein